MDVALTLTEAAQVLEPPLTERQLRALVRVLRWEPCGTRQTGRRGHPRATYPASDIFGLHAALMPFLRTTKQNA